MKTYEKPELELMKFCPQEIMLAGSGSVSGGRPGLDDDGYINTPDYPLG